LPFLEEESIIPFILEIAETARVFSVRGTAFFVLGLISKTTQGAELLDEFDWEATLTPLGETTGLCAPGKLAAFMTIPPWERIDCTNRPDADLPPPESTMEVQILSAISNLQNTVIANEAARALNRFKLQHRAIFSSVSLFYRVLHLLSTQRYRLPVRRYVLDLFDIDLDPDVMASILNISGTLNSLNARINGTGSGLGLSLTDEPDRSPVVSDEDL